MTHVIQQRSKSDAELIPGRNVSYPKPRSAPTPTPPPEPWVHPDPAGCGHWPEEVWRALLDTAEDAMFIKDTAGRYRIANQATATLLGCSLEELIGATDESFFPAAEVEKIRAADAEVFASNGRCCTEHVCSLASGQRIFRSIKWPYRDAEGNLLGLMAVCRDITGQRQAEWQLRTGEQFLRKVIDTAPNCIFVKDASGHYLLANKAVAQLFGTTTSEMVGYNDIDCRRPDEEVERFQEQDRKVVATQEPLLVPEEYVTDIATGKPRCFRTLKVPLRIEQNGLSKVHILGVATDITEQKQAERACAKVRRGCKCSTASRPR